MGEGSQAAQEGSEGRKLTEMQATQRKAASNVTQQRQRRERMRKPHRTDVWKQAVQPQQ